MAKHTDADVVDQLVAEAVEAARREWVAGEADRQANAIAAERERCAGVAEAFSSWRIAAAIRRG